MSLRPFKLDLLAFCGFFALAGCSTKETIPAVHIAPNTSGIIVGDIYSHGPQNLLGAIGRPPDVPSGVSASIQKIQPLHNKEPRYFIPASGVLQVVSIEKPENYNTQWVNFEGKLKKWEQFVNSEQLTDQEARRFLYDGDLQREIPWNNAGRCFHAKLRFRTFPWGKAVMFLTTYVQDNEGGPVNNDMLVLVVQGFTNDGRYAVNGHFEIHHPELPDSFWDKSTTGKMRIDLQNVDGRAEKWLDSQPDDSFEPTLEQYETFLRALQIAGPTRITF